MPSRTIAGNRQYISTGNLVADDRVCLFLMDYPRKARLKIYAHVDTLSLDDNPALAAAVAVAVEGYKADSSSRFSGCV